MIANKRFCGALVLVAAGFLVIFWQPSAQAFIEAPYTLGRIVNESTNVMLLRVEKVDKANNVIWFRKEKDLKGKHPSDVIVHDIGRRGIRPTEWKQAMEWADVGKTAVMFHNGNASETCIGTWWYQCYGGNQQWNHSHGEPYLLRSYAGNVEKLAAAVLAIAEGKEVVVPCMVDGNLEDLHQRRAKIQRLTNSLKLLDYNPKRDFAGWGGEDFRRLTGMAGFTHYAALARVDPDAQCISVVDIDGDGKLDVCLTGAGKLVVLNNAGESINEIALPGATGCRSAVWADYNGDGKPDLLLATASGLKLYTNLGKGQFRDDSMLLPTEEVWTVTAAAWIDQDGDGKPDILVANGYHGLRLYRNAAPAKFIDVSEQVGLGPKGIAVDVKGDTLTVCDVDGDGRPDFLYGAGSGILVMNTPAGFKVRENSGIAYKTGKVGPVFADFENNGTFGLVVPQKGGVKLFKNDGQGHFTDVTATAGDLAKFHGWATSACWGDVDNDGHLDLVLGCIRGPNRVFRNQGNGTFEDVTAKWGLGQRVFNSQAVALFDYNNSSALDFVFNNEGQESCILLSDPAPKGKKLPVTATVAGPWGVTGARVSLMDQAGKCVGAREISGGEGRGGQLSVVARFTVDPGKHRIIVRYSDGTRRATVVSVENAQVRVIVDEKTALARD
jgi:hypothetical protein